MSVEAQSTGAVVVAGTSGVAAIIAALTEATMGIFGVSLPVVLAAMTGACIARSYTPSRNFFAAAFATAGWTVVGCALAPLAHAVAKKYLDLDIPINATAGVALVASAGIPLVMPIIAEKLPEIFRSWLDRMKGGGK